MSAAISLPATPHIHPVVAGLLACLGKPPRMVRAWLTYPAGSVVTVESSQPFGPLAARVTKAVEPGGRERFYAAIVERDGALIGSYSAHDTFASATRSIQRTRAEQAALIADYEDRSLIRRGICPDCRESHAELGVWCPTRTAFGEGCRRD